MRYSEKFLDLYNKIDSILKKEQNHESQTSFAHRVKNSKNSIVKLYKEDLIAFGELRNAIVHSPKIGGDFIAEPHQQIVEELEKIFDKISNPKKVIPLFQFPVIGEDMENQLNSILKEMKIKSFSQFPIFDSNRKVIEIINTNTISRWLSSQMENNFTFNSVKVKDLISDIEFKNNYKFVSKDISIYDAYNFFIDHINTYNRNLDVLFITHSGNSNEKLLGLITIEDIASKITK